MEPTKAIGQNCIQAVLLLEASRGYIAKMLFADGDQTFRVGIQFLQAVRSVNDGDEGENHALVVLCQIVHKLAGVFPLLLHRTWDFGCEVVLTVLTLLPAGNVRLHTEDDALHFLDRLIRGNRDHVNRKNKVAGILGQIGNEIVGKERGIGTQKKDTANLVPKLKVVTFEAD